MTRESARAGVSTTVGAPAQRPTRRRRRSFAPLLYVAPAATVYGLFVLAPWGQSIWTSFWEWDGIGPATWAGIDNYVAVLTDPRLSLAIRNGIGFIVFYTVIPVAVGLVLAAVIAARPGRATGVVRTVLFLPQILPLVAVGIIWRLLYAADGPINQALRAIGLDGVARAWLGDFALAYPAVGLVGTWVTTGLCMMLLLSGIQRIDPSLYEAARLDRCGPVRQFLHVTVPGVRGEVVVAATVTMIAALASFDVVYVTTGGGPGFQTMVPGVLIYELVFTSNRVGVASALATVLSLLVLGLVLAIARMGRERS